MAFFGLKILENVIKRVKCAVESMLKRNNSMHSSTLNQISTPTGYTSHTTTQKKPPRANSVVFFELERPIVSTRVRGSGWDNNDHSVLKITVQLGRV